MSALVVDTSSWISYFKDLNNEIISSALREGRVHLPPIVIAEIFSAKLSISDQKKMTEFLSTLGECQCDFSHWIKVGELRRDLAKVGVHVSTPDAHIAQCALDIGAELLTEDKIFEHIQKHKLLKLA